MTKQETLWDKFLKPLSSLLINEEELKHLKNAINWQQETENFRNPEIVYPHYYLSQNFHGIKGGYLTIEAAVTYDPVTRYVFPPNETWVRREAIAFIGGQPRRILDLGCGTGSTTLLLKQTFVDGEIIGIDLSPYMLAMANYKAKQAGLSVQWQQGNALKTHFPDASFDVVTASLLFHETPPMVAESILKECFRLLIPGGQVIIFDGNQKILRQTPWLMEIFEEPYIEAYANESVEAWMGLAGFEAVQTQDIWLTNQVTRGIKPLSVKNYEQEIDENIDLINPIPVI
ncbi:Methyltransferase type 11 [Gloeothece citriformis PCC 7424]|uniref:Methyltransferase type 11 n=1 Tax=Gloeothece citriformis (strain PCC 7424) TaxID=65393 RepID=B7K6Z2_GLOC7|nr:class I SAM-dependent methyltransferase [Gloeothece citriformis]ACK72691.1 Methyltransferase type 11 [Gloeothece citriformis PCC 7424]